MKKEKTIMFSVVVVCVSLFLCSAGCQNVAGGGSTPTSVTGNAATVIPVIKRLTYSSPVLTVALTGETTISTELTNALGSAPKGKINLELSQTQITSIGSGAFSKCPSLASVYVKATNPPNPPITNDIFYGNNNLKIYVPSASVAAYKGASYWSDCVIVADPNN